MCDPGYHLFESAGSFRFQRSLAPALIWNFKHKARESARISCRINYCVEDDLVSPGAKDGPDFSLAFGLEDLFMGAVGRRLVEQVGTSASD